MKSMMKILIRYVASAAGVALILLILNAAAMILWTALNSSNDNTEENLAAISASLKKQRNGFEFTDKGESAFSKHYQWAMLLDGSGNVIWSFDLPGDIPRNYTISDIAGFARWYLKGYPVSVWQHPDGLLVLGRAKDSTWKMAVEMPEEVIKNSPSWFVGIIILNWIVAILLAMLFGVRLFRSLRPIVKGIEDMAEKRAVELPAAGLLGDVAAKLNQASLQLQKQEAALQKRDSARTTWIAGVSHDIRTPLSLVMGYANQLEESPVLPCGEREKARIIRNQSEKIKALVSDLNLASKLEYDMQPLNPAPVYPAALARNVAAEFLNSRNDDRYSIYVNIADSAKGSVVTGDERLLRRAISNLITNSIRHNPDSCELTIAVETVFSWCIITVSDNGTGYPAEVMEGLKNQEIPSELGNHGLGLTLVRQIAKAHGGRADFRNLPEGGCSAVIQLPLKI